MLKSAEYMGRRLDLLKFLKTDRSITLDLKIARDNTCNMSVKQERELAVKTTGL